MYISTTMILTIILSYFVGAFIESYNDTTSNEYDDCNCNANNNSYDCSIKEDYEYEMYDRFEKYGE